MGAYLNSQTPYTLYQSESRSPYFVDKTMLLQELFPYVAAGNRHLCVTRPRRFGKTIAANMISSFFQKGIDSGELFDRLKISEADDCQKYKNKYNVIRIDFSKMPRNCESYRQYIERVEELLISDLREAYPDAKTSETDAIGDILEEIFQQYHGEKFIFVLDEWDFIFHREFITEADKAKYVAFLSNLLKDRPYVILSYMTGILPIAKYSSGSELNMFAEFTMVNSPMFGTYFGFTDDEVDDLYERYCRECEKQRKIKNVTRKGLRDWYNGYYTKSGERVYNPRSVVFALQFNNLANYWTSSGPYDEISGIEIFTFPELIFSTVMAANARISTRNTAAYRERRRKFSIWKLFSFPVIFFFSDIRSSIRIIFLRIPSDPDRRPLPEG